MCGSRVFRVSEPRDGQRLVNIAREAVGASVVRGHAANVAEPLGFRAPVFVTLRRRDGALRGCIGTLRPVEGDVTAETARNAVLAATRDPRFPPVTPDELPGLDVEVSVLLPEERVAHLAQLDPARYGVVVRDADGRQGVLLPDVPGVDDAEAQVRIARQKGGIAEGVDVTLHRFEVRKYR